MSTTDLKVTPARVLLSEWTKLRTVRSTVWSLLAVLGFLIGFAILVPEVIVHHWPPPSAHDRDTFDAVGASLVGGFFAQLAFGVLGVLVITGEYSTGMIRASLSAVPKRIPMLWAKAVVFALTCLMLGAVAQLSAFFLGQAILSSKGINVAFGDPHVARVVLGGALYFTGVGLLGLGLGALLRNTAGAITSLIALQFVVPTVVHFLPVEWNDTLESYLPTNAGTAIMNVHPDPTALGPWTGLLVFFLYGVVALVLAGVALVRRDA